MNIETNLKNAINPQGGIIFAHQVNDPERYGVVEFDKNNNVLSLEEKPEKPKSRYAVPGLYFYDNTVIEICKKLKPSPRGELEITDVNKSFLKKNQLRVEILDRGTAWLDTGTIQSLKEAGEFVEVIENRQGTKIGCIEEIAYLNGFITKDQLKSLAQPLLKSGYGEYLLDLAEAL